VLGQEAPRYSERLGLSGRRHDVHGKRHAVVPKANQGVEGEVHSRVFTNGAIGAQAGFGGRSPVATAPLVMLGSAPA
jgi:hypothetical protein